MSFHATVTRPEIVVPGRPARRRFAPVGALVVALALLASPAARADADDVPSPVMRAGRTIEREGKMIMAWVYPTVTFRRLNECSWGTSAGAFNLDCSFTYADSDGEIATRSLRFLLSDAGAFKEVVDRGGDSIVPAFLSLRFMKDVIRDMARDELASAETPRTEADQALLRLLAASPDPERVLTFLLNAKLLAQR